MEFRNCTEVVRMARVTHRSIIKDQCPSRETFEPEGFDVVLSPLRDQNLGNVFEL